MKKVLIIILSLALMLTFVACGEKNDGISPSESSEPSESGIILPSRAGAEENKYYGIGEAAKVDGIEITIDKLEIVDDLDIFQKYDERYVYVKVYATVKNISDETQFAEEPLLRIIRDGEHDSELSGHSCNIDVWNFETDEMYFDEAIYPGETNSGWTVFPLEPDEKEIIVKYNVIYDTVKFKVPIV